MRVSYKQIEASRASKLARSHKYEMVYWQEWDYSFLSMIMYQYKTGKGRTGSWNNIIIAADTETSKMPGAGKEPKNNHVVAWTISLRAFDMNLVTLWGRKPSEMITCIRKLQKNMKGDETVIYFYNLNYDWCFLRKFFFREYDHPDQQLNTKPHYPLYIKWKDKGLILKDALMLGQRKLERWASDLEVEHQKAVGSWEYDKIRNQNEDFSSDELHYIENDTLALCECIQATLKALNKTIYSIPYTATGIIRQEIREIGKKNHAHDAFKRQALSFPLYLIMLKVYHGGFTHSNRFLVNTLIDWSDVICYDFTSSYPYCLLSEMYPSGRFVPYKNCSPELILKESKYHAFIFRLTMINFKLKDPLEPMPYLQYYKITNDINIMPEDIDNGRVVKGGYAEIWLNEVDLSIIMKQYDFQKVLCEDVYYCNKAYLPRWFTDYVYELFKAKCELKGGDPVLYALAKARLNSVYGLTVQRSVMDEIEEIYELDPLDPVVYERKKYDMKELEAKYNKYVESRNSILNYQIGVWCTAYAARNLILGLGSCIKDSFGPDGKRTTVSSWYYSDTDSIYSDSWDQHRIDMYNQMCKMKLQQNGYGPVVVNGKEFWLGVATLDKIYTEFKYQGAKRYCGRDKEDKKLHITVAGVPKKGVDCLDDDINNFVPDLIFDGQTTGKLAHYYVYNEEIFTDPYGNEVGDSIDLQPCDYRLDQTEQWDFIEQEIVTVPVYGEE